MKKYLFYTFVFLATTTTVYGQNSTYSATVNSSSGQNYSVNIEIELTDIVPVQSSCAWGYNYDVAYDYDIQINGNNSNLYTLAGYLTCGSNPGIYFDLPNNGGSGSSVTQGNPWNSNSDCATATVASLMCDSISIQIEGPGIPNQFISLGLNNNEDNGDDQDWGMDGNNADTTSFIGTTNANPLVLRTNNEERMRITEDGNIGIGVLDPLEKLELEGNLRLTEDIIFSGYIDSLGVGNKILIVDENGRTKAITKSKLTQYITRSDCFMYTNGVITEAPTWASDHGLGSGSVGSLYTGATCPARVGIGTSTPQAKLHIQTNVNNPNEKLFLIERKIGNHAPYSVFQVTNDGLVRSREVKVDLDSWPDYVFKKDYPLMPLNEVKAFIDANGHLPNVPSAIEIETDGVNLGNAAKISMEKIEELTLYLIQQQEQLDEQKHLIEEQRKLIEIQQQLLEEHRKALETMKSNPSK